MAKVEIKNTNLGGIADSMYQGAANSVAEMVGLDIHSEAGIIKVNQALTKDSGVVVDEFCKVGVACSNGSTYMFGDAGGIFERESNGTWTDRGTVAPAAGGTAILGAGEHKGYIYFATESRLGRFAVPTAGTAISISNNYGTFTVTDDTYHPMKTVNQVLYIGDGYLVAQVDNGAFSANALDLDTDRRISALGQFETDLLIGTYTSANLLRAEVYRWNTWSVSYTVADDLPEVGINAFLDTDNSVLISAGTKGRFYEFNGSKAVEYGKIQGIFTKGTTDKVTVYPYSSLNFDSLPMFGVSQVSGNAAKQGIYSLGRHSASYPRVMNVEYLASTGNEDDMQYGAIVGAGDVFVVAWKNNDDSSVGVDVLDTANKFTGAYIKSRVVKTDRKMKSNYGVAHAFYRSLPSGTNVVQKYIKNYGSEVTMNQKDDTDRLMLVSDEDMGEASTVQYKAEFTVSGNNAPEVEGFEFDVK
jgi:hypothetical protein